MRKQLLRFKRIFNREEIQNQINQYAGYITTVPFGSAKKNMILQFKKEISAYSY